MRVQGWLCQSKKQKQKKTPGRLGKRYRGEETGKDEGNGAVEERKREKKTRVIKTSFIVTVSNN